MQPQEWKKKYAAINNKKRTYVINKFMLNEKGRSEREKEARPKSHKNSLFQFFVCQLRRLHVGAFMCTGSTYMHAYARQVCPSAF